jgi:pimeloyl-ACP methyl ester carboxylesterase
MITEKLKPFKVNIPQEQVDDLKLRLKNARWIKEAFDQTWSKGIPVSHLKELAAYWTHDFDWRAQEEKINRYPQFTTTVDGQTIHLFHIRSRKPNAFPLFLLHGYPSSFMEMMPLIDLLTNAEPAFDIIIPSLPGYGFSSPLNAPGWSNKKIATAFINIANELQCEQYGIHATDIGGGVAQWMANMDSAHVKGVHVSTDVGGIALLGRPLPEPDDKKFSVDARKRIERLHALQKEGRGYLQLQSTRPLSASYAFTDSPIGLLAWIAEKFKEWTDQESTKPDGIDRDVLLTNVSIYWFTRTAFTAANLIYENFHSSDGWAQPGPTPLGFAAVDPDEIVRNSIDQERRIKHWSLLQHAWHFPALEIPEALADDIRKFFNSIKSPL